MYKTDPAGSSTKTLTIIHWYIYGQSPFSTVLFNIVEAAIYFSNYVYFMIFWAIWSFRLICMKFNMLKGTKVLWAKIWQILHFWLLGGGGGGIRTCDTYNSMALFQLIIYPERVNSSILMMWTFPFFEPMYSHLLWNGRWQHVILKQKDHRVTTVTRQLPWLSDSYHGYQTVTMVIIVTRQLPWLPDNYHGHHSYQDYQTVTMVTRQLPRLPDNYHGYQTITMVTRQLPWLSDNYHGYQSSYHGYQTITMVTRQLPWLPDNYHGYQTVTMVTIVTRQLPLLPDSLPK